MSSATATTMDPTTAANNAEVPVVPSSNAVPASAPAAAAPPASGEQRAFDPANSVAVGVDELITGRKTKFPIYDENGVLLLAEGMPITADVKRNLKGRGLEKVSLNKADAATATLAASNVAVPVNFFPTFDEELTKKLDAVLETDLRVTNKGPSVKNSVVDHGKAGYKEEVKQKLVTQHQQTCEVMDTMMQDALNGKRVSGTQITRCAASFLSNLIDDRDASVSLSQEMKNDNDLADHSLKMSLLAMAIGIEMGMDSENVRRLGITALVQDWGMSLVPKEIRYATRTLTADEALEIQKHPIQSLNMIQRVLALPEITGLVAYQVHERPDGSGYPRGRDERTIHPFAKILRVADEFVALTTERGHRKALMPYGAMECLLRLAQSRKLDKDAVRALLHVNSLFPVGSFVALSDGSVAQVARRNGNNYTEPLVRRVTDGEGTAIPFDPAAEFVNLAEAGLKITQAVPTPGRDEILYQPPLLERCIR